NDSHLTVNRSACGHRLGAPPGRLLQAGGQLQRAQVLQQLRDAAGTEDHRGHVRIAQAPGDRERRGAHAQLAGQRGEARGARPQARALAALQALAQPRLAVGARALRDAVCVLAGQQPGGQRRPHRGAHAELAIQRRVLQLDPAPVEQVVLRLLHRRRRQVVRARHVVGLAHQRRRPFRGAPVEHLALAHQHVHGGHRLRHRHVRIRAVAEEQVQVVHAQPPQRGVAGVADVLAREPALHRPRLLGGTEHHLAGHREPVARQPQVGDHVAHHPLGLAVGVVLRVVEEVDAVVPGRGHQLSRHPPAHAGAEGGPGAQRERRQRQSRRAQPAVFHAPKLPALRSRPSLRGRRGILLRRRGAQAMQASDGGVRDMLGRLMTPPDEVMRGLGDNGERVVAQVRLLLSGLALAVPLLAAASGAGMPRVLACLGAVVLANAVALLWLVLARRHRPWLGFATTAWDVGLVTAVLAAMLVRDPVYGGQGGAAWAFYLLAIAATALRADGRVALAGGALALGGSGLLALVVRLRAAGAEAALPTADALGITGELLRLLMLVLATAVAALLVRRMQSLVELSGHDALTGLPNR